MNITDIIFSTVNLPLTILTIILILYWIVTMVSGIDFDMDVDIDIDVDMDVDVDADIDVDSTVEGGNLDFHDVANAEVNKEDIIGIRRKPLKWWQVLLIYFNFVGLPFMFTFTSWIFIWWICTASATVITQSFNNSFGFILMVGLMIPALFITKIFTSPFKSFFRNLNQNGDAPTELIGRTGVSQSTIKDDKLGSAEVLADENPLSINIKSLDGTQINFRDQILIIKQSNDKTFYYVQTYNN